jgi:hypothetical protein
VKKKRKGMRGKRIRDGKRGKKRKHAERRGEGNEMKGKGMRRGKEENKTRG